MNISSFTYIDYIYLSLLLIFAALFALKGATRAISYSLKIILSISLPFLFYKKTLNFFIESMDNPNLNSIAESNSIFLEIVIFTVLFILIFLIYSIIEKAINIKSPSQFEFKVIDTLIGGIYGIFIFSFIFYFSYQLLFKNHIPEKNNLIMNYNISLFDKFMNKNNKFNNDSNNDNNIKENKSKNEKTELY